MADDEKNTTGEIDPSIWDEAPAVTGRPVDLPLPNTTFAERAKATPAVPAVEEEQDKPAPRKTARTRK